MTQSIHRRHVLAGGLALAASLPARAQAPAAIKIGWGSFPDVPQLAQAFDKNLWAAQGLAPQVVPFASGRDSFEALIGGQLEFAIAAEFPAVTGALRGRKFTVPAVLSKFKALRVIARSATPVTSLQQLAGQRIGVTTGTNQHFLLGEALRKANVQATIVNVAPPDMIPALTRGDVAAAMMFPSAYGAARRALAANYQELMLPEAAQSFILIASERASADPAMIGKVLATLIEGEKLLAANEAESIEATARYVRGAVTAENIKAVWSDYEYRVQLDQGTVDLMVRAGRWIVEQGFVKDVTPTPDLMLSRFLPGPLRALAADRVTASGLPA